MLENNYAFSRQDAIVFLSGKTVLYLVSRNADKGFVKEILEQSGGMLFLAENPDAVSEILSISRIDLLIVDLPLEYLDLKEFCSSEAVKGKTDLKLLGLGDVPEDEKHYFTEIIPKPVKPQAFYYAVAKALNAKVASALDFPDTKHIKFNEGLMRVGGNIEAYARVLDLFSVSQRMVAEEIRFALNGRREGDLHTAECLSHSLKGVAANIAANSVNNLAAELEQALKHGEHEKAGQVLVKLERAMEETLSQIDTWLELKTKGDCHQAVPVWGEADNYSEARGLLEQLVEPIHLRQPVKCEEVLQKICERKWPVELESEVDQLGVFAKSYSFVKAEQVLRGLLKQMSGGNTVTEISQ